MATVTTLPTFKLLGSTITLSPNFGLILLSLLVGVASHATFWIHSERDHLASRFVGLSVILPTAAHIALALFTNHTFSSAYYTAASIYLGYLAGLTGSILLYRLFLHPLRNYPGPIPARVTKWYGTFTAVRTGMKYNTFVCDLHKKYGPIVRTGPNELSINQASLLPEIAKFAKAPMYDLGLPERSIHSTREIEPHKARRKVWDRAFTAPAVNDYVPRIHAQTENLLKEIRMHSALPIKISDFLNYYNFDVMGDLTFGRSFDLLATKGTGTALKDGTSLSGTGAYFMHMAHKSQVIVSLFLHVPWFPRMLQWIPGANKEFDDFVKWCDDMVNVRKGMEETRVKEGAKRDIFSFLLEAEPENVGPHRTPLGGEARLAMIAGSDTTSTTMQCVLANLAANPMEYFKLQAEIDELYNTSDCKDGFPVELRSGFSLKTRHLDGVIREALRLNPPISNALARDVPRGGYTFTLNKGEQGKEQIHLIEGTKVYVPLYTTMRDEKNFERAEEFLPERWYAENRETMVKDPHAYNPFQTGMFSCVGKSVALLQLRIVTAKIMRNFNFRWPEVSGSGDSVADKVVRKDMLEKVMRNARDTFTITMGDMEMIFEERKV